LRVVSCKLQINLQLATCNSQLLHKGRNIFRISNRHLSPEGSLKVHFDIFL
jgi:hypothetical protein